MSCMSFFYILVKGRLLACMEAMAAAAPIFAL
jgi:hypothetical protein